MRALGSARIAAVRVSKGSTDSCVFPVQTCGRRASDRLLSLGQPETSNERSEASVKWWKRERGDQAQALALYLSTSSPLPPTAGMCRERGRERSCERERQVLVDLAWYQSSQAPSSRPSPTDKEAIRGEKELSTILFKGGTSEGGGCGGRWECFSLAPAMPHGSSPTADGPTHPPSGTPGPH
jgi:hypothetical protein